jgi:gliding motility-associated-like protein
MKTITKYLLVAFILLGSTFNSKAQCVVLAPVPNDACYQQVIVNDTWCCNTAWDAICQGAYDACVPPPPVGCPVVPPVPTDGCYQSVIAADPNCCNVAWDVTCQDAYDNCTSVIFPCTGGTSNFVVPPCITEVTILASGAQGGGALGGLGADVNGTITVVPGQVLIVSVGCQGGAANGSGGFGGGGSGVNSNSGFPSFGGGGASFVSTTPGGMGNAVVVAGGGGGTGGGDTPGMGGEGGCPNGTAGETTFGLGGSGGTGAAGGAGGPAWTAGGGAGGNGSLGQGGAGGPDLGFLNNPGGGGGGGYYGGGGGGSDNIAGVFAVGGGGGGAGSSLIPVGGGCTQGVNAGNGQIIIAYGCETSDPTGSNPAGINVQCPANVPASNIAVVTDEADNCGAPAVAFVGDVSDNGSCPEIITRTYSITDPCLNQILVTQIITILDTQVPVLAAAPANVLVDCGAIPPPVNLNWTDNCDGAGNVAPVDGPLVGGTCGGTITRTWTYIDVCGNSASVNQTITMNDNVNPVFAVPPANITVDCIGNVPAMTNLAYTDNCDASGNVAGTDAALAGGSCGGTITRTWTYTDACGNNASVTQTITVDDNTAPVFAAAPANVTIDCIGNIPAMTNLGYTDNCDAAGNVPGIDGALIGGSCGGTITRTWTFTDDCGNVGVSQQVITIDDNVAPALAAPPANVTVECETAVPAMVNVNWTDNCDGAGSIAGVDGPLVGGNCGGTITRTWTYTDVCGNVATVNQTITIDDNTNPTASNPLDINTTGALPGQDITVVTDEADNCSAPTVAWVSDVSDNGSCPETITRTYSVTDACGNSINVIQLIIIGDANPPTGTAPADIGVQCASNVPAANPLLIIDEADNAGVPVVTHLSDVSDNGSCPEIITRTYSITDNCGNVTNVIQLITILDTQVPVFSAPPGAITVECIGDVPLMTNLAYTDNCDPNGNVVGIDGGLVGTTCGGVITRTWSFTDICGNNATVTQIITIDDTTDPVFAGAPVAITVECLSDVPVMTNLAYTDNCDAPGNVAGVDGALVGTTCGGTITRTWTFTDPCGNNATVTQTITIDDTTDPMASNPADINVAGGAAPAPDVNEVIDEADNCDPTPTVAFVSDVSDNASCPETITRTYSVTDDCGNTIDVIQLILIGDPNVPTASNPLGLNVECITAVPAPNPLVVTDEADDSGIPPTVVWVSDVSDGNSCPETIIRTYSVTDNCVNVITVSQTITVNDITDPTASNLPAIAFQCSADVTAADILDVTDEADNCGTPAVAFVGDVSDNLTCPETITRTYSVTDSCGNSIDVTQIITVDDTTDPLATAPVAVNIECITAVPATNIADVTGVSDNCTAAPVVAFVSDVSDGLTCPETISRTYSITDDCGNTINVVQTITVNDVTDPTASNAAQTIVPGGPAPAPDPTVIIDETDNCGTPTVAFVSQLSDNNPCPESIVYTYSVTDSCGNSINVTHEVLITDPIAPTGTPPAALNVECITAVPAADPALIVDEADNNGVPTVTHLSDVSDNGSCPETITRTYRITDPCSNFIDVVQLITVHDLTDPTASNLPAIAFQCSADVTASDILDVTDEADNCGTPTVAFVGDVSDLLTCPETITRTYSVTDSCGNSIDVTQIITVDDTTEPTATNPPAVNVECIADVPLADITVVADEADNCTAVPIVAFLSDVSDGNTCPELITRTYSVNDDCGNSINVTQTITVNDLTDPTASNPLDIIVPGGPAPAPDVNEVTDEADNCAAVPTVVWVLDVSDNNACPETITRTYSVTDDCGNQILVIQNVIIIDPIDPTGTAPADVNVECIGDVPAADPTLIIDEADNNGPPTVAFVDDVSDNNTCPETITRTYSITDPCGNVITLQQLIIVNDITNPTASSPATINVECSADVPANDISVVADEADNCTANPVVAYVSDVSDGNACPETITRTYSVTDDCNNSVNVTQTIIVNDVTNPTASNPAAFNVECSADVPAANVADITDEADNCTAAPFVAFVSDVSDGNTCPELITRTYSVTDDCGNSINLTQLITINDITNPTASNPAAINVSCASNVPVADPAVVADADDNCGAPAVAFVSDVSDGNTCNSETITRTYSVTDDCGNTINVTQLIVIDVTTPTFDAGVDQDVCEGTMVTLTVSNPNAGLINWDNGVTDGLAFNSPIGITVYNVTTQLCGGECSATDQVSITVHPTPVVSFEGDDLFGCEPHLVTFTNFSTEQGDCTWDFGDGNTANSCGPVSNTYENGGQYDVTLTVTSSEGCTVFVTYTGYVSITPYPVAAFTYSPHQIGVLDTEVEFTNESLNADSYSWIFGDQSASTSEIDPTHTFPVVGDVSYTVTLLASNDGGCVDQTSVVIYVQDELLFFVPNIFTPDGNNVNNEFFPVFTSGYDFYDYHMTIFNRWGEVMHETYNSQVGWNGHFGDGGLVDDGVYVWQIEFGETGSDKRQKHRGYVTVLK